MLYYGIKEVNSGLYMWEPKTGKFISAKRKIKKLLDKEKKDTEHLLERKGEEIHYLTR